MDLIAVTSLRSARTDADLRLGEGETVLGGGTWLFSEPQPGVTGLVDLTTLGWPDHEVVGTGVRIGATCTIERLAALPATVLGTAVEPVRRSVDALLMSFKVQHAATVGGNICLALPAGAMTALFTGLDAAAVLWLDGTTRRVPVADLVTDVRTTGLRPGEVLRAVDVPSTSLQARHAFAQIALTPAGRSSAVVTGRLDRSGAVTIGVTAATRRPVVLRFEHLPSSPAVDGALAEVDCWYTDPHGPADWRRAVTRILCRQVVEELAA